MPSFKFVVNGELVSCDRYEDIPNDFEHVIEFVPDLPEPEGEDGGHTEEQHEQMLVWNTRLQELMERERASSN
jgi:hypothetical protein